MKTAGRRRITEEVLKIKDLLRENDDEVLDDLCERMMDRLDMLAKANMEDYE